MTDGEHVWVTFLYAPNVVVACYDVEGKLIWQKSVGEFHSVHGYSSSPVLYKNLLILNEDQDDPKAYIVALDKITHKEEWRIPAARRAVVLPAVDR